MLNGFLVLLFVAWAVIVIWGVILWIRVGTRWLRLHPAPARVRELPATASDLQTRYAADLRVWATTIEPASALAQRLGIGVTAASRVSALAMRAASGSATGSEWEDLRPWLPRLLQRD